MSILFRKTWQCRFGISFVHGRHQPGHVTDHPVKIGDSSGLEGEREAREDEQRFISGTETRAEQ